MMLSSYIIYAVVVGLCFLVFSKVVRRPCSIPLYTMALNTAVIVACHAVLEWCYNLLQDGPATQLLFAFSTILYCLFTFAILLLMDRVNAMKTEYADLQRFIAAKNQYYRISREGILSLQMKCRDLKHQIASIRSAAGKAQFEQYLDDLETSIDEYNTVVRTGNESLDVVLTEKNILCLGHHIRFTYMVDGKQFDFLEETEVCSLFGNALDNAIECVKALPDPQNRIVSLRAVRKGDQVLLHVENSFQGQLRLERGFPVTTKADPEHHGLGLRSIQALAEKYGGSASVCVERGVFNLNVLLPCPQEAD